MPNLEDLTDHINAGLIYREMGLDDKSITESFNEDGLSDDEIIAFVFKAMAMVQSESEKHWEPIAEILTRGDDPEDDGFDEIKAYLLKNKVSEKLIDIIYTYLVFKMVVAQAILTIEEGMKQGKNEREIKEQLLELGLEKEMVDGVYMTAMTNFEVVPEKKDIGTGIYWIIMGSILAGVGIWVSTDKYSDSIYYGAIGLGIFMVIRGFMKLF